MEQRFPGDFSLPVCLYPPRGDSRYTQFFGFATMISTPDFRTRVRQKAYCRVGQLLSGSPGAEVCYRYSTHKKSGTTDPFNNLVKSDILIPNVFKSEIFWAL